MTQSNPHSSLTAPIDKLLPVVIGVGSPNFEDCIGWEVIDHLNSLPNLESRGVLHKAAVPHDALDWLDAARTTHIVDASLSDAAGPLRLTITRDLRGELQGTMTDNQGLERHCEFPRLQSNSTHQFDLLSVLRLADALGRLPRRLILWAIPIRLPAPDAICPSTLQHPQFELLLTQCVQQIALELPT
jgi:Ni,Fe-hydrogenase maturation factor